MKKRELLRRLEEAERHIKDLEARPPTIIVSPPVQPSIMPYAPTFPWTSPTIARTLISTSSDPVKYETWS